MLLRVAKLSLALGLLLALWGFNRMRESDDRVWLRPAVTRPGPVRIIQFYASTGMLSIGQKALLCYGVENARSVRISPTVAGVYPSPNHCLEIVPEHTTHYTLMAEGYDGRVAMQSVTLAVTAEPPEPGNLNYALYFRITSRSHSRMS